MDESLPVLYENQSRINGEEINGTFAKIASLLLPDYMNKSAKCPTATSLLLLCVFQSPQALRI